MDATIVNVTNEYAGQLVSTTDIKAARLLGRRLTIGQILSGRPGHYEQDGSSLVIIAGNELYELVDC